MAEISVIVPVYNVEKFLPRCAESILRQSMEDIELILIDDGSSDSSGEICDYYAQKDRRVKVVHRKNRGQAAAKNTGLETVFSASQGKWIAFIDSDDQVHHEYLEALYSSANNAQTEIAVCSLMTFDGTGQLNDARIDPSVCITPEELWEVDRLAATIPVCKLFSKGVLQGFRFPEGKVHEDELSVYRVLFSCDRIAYTSSPLYYYFQNPDGITLQKKWTPERADSVTAFSEQCDYFRKRDFLRAEKISAQALLCSCAEALYQLTTYYPDEKRLIRCTRAVMRQTVRRYRDSLDFSAIGGEKTYIRYAHPALMKAKKVKKRVIRFIGRLFHA